MILHLRGRLHPGRQGQLIRFLSEAIPVYERPGGITVRLLVNSDDPDLFLESVEYANTEVYAADQQRVESDPQMMAYLDRWREFLVEPVSVERYEDATRRVLEE